MDAPLLCIDAGGTHTRARLVAPDGAVLAEARSGPGNVSTDPLGAAASVAACWDEAATLAGLDRAAPERVDLAAGMAGTLAATQLVRFEAACLPFRRRVVMTDGYAALIGAGGGKPCALLVVGTGVAGHRLFADGSSVLRDGWGWLLGDRGSAVWLGLGALRHALAALDGVEMRGPLADSVLEAARREAGGLRPWLVDMRPARLGALAPLVFAAEAGDPAAAELVGRGLQQLADLARQLELSPDLPFYLAGGLAPVIGARLGARLPCAALTPEADARHGCWLVATGRAPGERRVEVER